MPGAISDFLENKLVDHTLRNVVYNPPASVWMALYTANPTDADVGVEVAGGNYARRQVTFGAPANGVTTNSAEIRFPTAAAGWGHITHFGIRDAAAGGNLLYHGELAAHVDINIGDIFVVPVGQLSVTMA